MNNFDEAVKVIVEVLPNIQGVIISGSAADGSYIENISDVDVTIIGPRNPDVRQQLVNIKERLGEQFDIHYLTLQSIAADFKSICSYGEYRYHGMDRYRLKHHSKVVYGDAAIMDLIPNLSLKDALDDILPHIKNKTLPDLKEKAESCRSAVDFIDNEQGKLLVIVRTMFSVETDTMGSKLESLKYLQEKYPEHAVILKSLEKAFLKEKEEPTVVSAGNIKTFLSEADRVFSHY